MSRMDKTLGVASVAHGHRWISCESCKSCLSCPIWSAVLIVPPGRDAYDDQRHIGDDAGLKTVAERAGIDWQALQDARQGTDWEAVLEDNLQEMLGAGLWGVPSFRVSGGNSSGTFACWGQDRIWRVENEIAKRALG